MPVRIMGEMPFLSRKAAGMPIVIPIPVCSSLPYIYLRIPNVAHTDCVCSSTQRPPMVSPAIETINRRLTLLISFNTLEPFASSKNIWNRILDTSGSIHRNHLSKNTNITRKITTHPHIQAITFKLFSIACVIVNDFTEGIVTFLLLPPGKIMAVSMAERMMMSQIIHVYMVHGK